MHLRIQTHIPFGYVYATHATPELSSPYNGELWKHASVDGQKRRLLETMMQTPMFVSWLCLISHDVSFPVPSCVLSCYSVSNENNWQSASTIRSERSMGSKYGMDYKKCWLCCLYQQLLCCGLIPFYNGPAAYMCRRRKLLFKRSAAKHPTVKQTTCLLFLQARAS